MSTQPTDGGPAFPHLPYSSDSRNWSDGSKGMSLRDYLATHAPASEIERIVKCNFSEHYPMAVAKARMIWADAMLAARRKEDA